MVLNGLLLAVLLLRGSVSRSTIGNVVDGTVTLAKRHQDIGLNDGKKEDSKSPAVWEIGPNSTPVDVIKFLRHCGFSDELLSNFALLIVREREGVEKRILNTAGMPNWRARSVRLTGEQRQMLEESRRKSIIDARSILAELGISELNVNALQRKRYEGYSEEKVAKLKQIIDDYAGIRKNSRTQSPNSNLQTSQAIEAEMISDIRTLLTAEEFETYMLYHSNKAAQLQMRIGDAGISDEQYVQLLKAEAVYREQNASITGKPVPQEESYEYRAGRLSTLRSIVGDELTLAIEVRHDTTFGPMASIYREGGISTAELLNKYQVYLDLFAAVKLSPATSQGLAKDAYVTLLAGLNPALRAKFESLKIANAMRSFQQPVPPLSK
jgi:hypothetical protein